MPIEDFTTYTEEDDNNKLTVIASTATAADVDWDEDVWLVKDFLADHFDALDIDFECRIEDTSGQDSTGGVALSNQVGDIGNFLATDFVVRVYEGGVGIWKIFLTRGPWTAHDSWDCLPNTPYYCTITRPAGNDTVTVDIYDDSGRTNKVGTLTLAGFGAAKWRYAYGFVNYNNGTPNRNLDGYVKNFDLKECPIVTTPAVSDIQTTTATGNGTIVNVGLENASKRGVCWNTTGSPTVADNKSEETGSFGVGAFTRPMTGLTPGEHYYVKAYAYNSYGYGYGSEVEFLASPITSWLAGYGYRKGIEIEGSITSGKSNYQMKMTVHKGSGSDSDSDVYCGGNCKDDFGDVRWADSDGTTLLDYWIEEMVSGDYAIFWVEIPYIPKGSSVGVYLYYKNPTVSSISNGLNTFDLFDDFESGRPNSLPDVLERYAGNPVIPYDPAGDASSSVREGTVCYVGGTYYYYYGKHLTAMDPRTIHLATSPDGYAFTKQGLVLEPTAGTWDAEYPGDQPGMGLPVILYHDGEWWLYYSGGDPSSGGLAKSSDGINFTKISNGIGGTSKVLEVGAGGAWDAHSVQPTCVIYREDLSEFWMYYRGWDSVGGTGCTGLATSSDGINWTKHNGNPIVTPTEAWEGPHVICWRVFSYEGKWRAYYRGNNGWDNKIGYAESDDGISWTKHEENPIIGPIGTGWERGFVLSPQFIFKENDPTKLGLLYYTALDVGHNQIGVMTQVTKGIFAPALNGWEKILGVGDFLASQDYAKFGSYSLKVIDNTTGDNIFVAKDTGLSFSDYCRFILWVRYNSNSEQHSINLTQNKGAENFSLAARDDGHFKYFNGASFINLPIDTTYIANTWYKVEVIVDIVNQQFVKIKIDDIEKGSGLASGFGGTYVDDPVFNHTDYAGTEIGYFDTVILAKYIDPEPAWGAWGSAEILPEVTTNAATGLSAVSATLNGTLDDDGGEACDCGFEWGLDTGYGTITPTESKTTDETFSQVIGGLAPNTTYHFRAFATNSEGTRYGADRTFTTALIICKAYALAREGII